MATFYSKQTGNWEDGANWASLSHTGTAGASPGTKGTDWPGSGDTAVISAGHTITVTTDLSGEASAIVLQCDAPGTNNGTLSFLATATTGLKATLASGGINASSTLNLRLGTSTAPIQRGNTCTLTTGGGVFAPTSGTLTVEAWGQHREANTTDIYADTLTVAASRGNTSITLNGSILPLLAANDWIFLTEYSSGTASTTKPAAELVQVDSYNSGTKVATLKTPLKYDYTTTNGAVYRVRDHKVNTLLAADHTSGADYVLEDDLYPLGTVGGSFLLCRANNSQKAGNTFDTVSSYNSGTKTLTASNSSATTSTRGSFLLMDDFNVSLIGSATSLLGNGNGRHRFCYVKFDTWQNASKGSQAATFINCNLFDCKSINATGTSRLFLFGVGTGQKSGAAVANLRMVDGGSTNGGHIIDCNIYQCSDDSLNGIQNLTNWFCYNSNFMPLNMNAIQSSTFLDCSFGNNTQYNSARLQSISNCVFSNCWFYNATVSGASIFQIPGNAVGNVYNNLKFGTTRNGKSLPNAGNIVISDHANSVLVNGLTFDASEPDPSFSTIPTGRIFTSLVRGAMLNGVTNQFRNWTPGGKAEHDTSGYRTSSPSVKFTHSSATDPVFFDIPVYLTSGSKTFSIYTNPSTGSWSSAPSMLILPEYAADLVMRDWTTLPYLDRAQQSTLTTSTYSQLQLTTSIPTTGVYIVRLWARNASGTVNWDDFTVS